MFLQYLCCRDITSLYPFLHLFTPFITVYGLLIFWFTLIAIITYVSIGWYCVKSGDMPSMLHQPLTDCYCCCCTEGVKFAPFLTAKHIRCINLLPTSATTDFKNSAFSNHNIRFYSSSSSQISLMKSIDFASPNSISLFCEVI